jgi:hypothetical protein
MVAVFYGRENWARIGRVMASEYEKAACKKKVRYGNPVAAENALKLINPRHASKKPTRFYKCPVCAGWHLTSKPK